MRNVHEAVAARGHGDAGPPGVALPWIDWVRFLAAFEVFLFHLRPFLFEPYERFAPAHKNVAVILWFAVTHFGSEAVLIFFALSGYLVGGGLIERVRAGSFQPRDYAIDRATRLLVPFLPAMAMAVGLQWLKHEPVDSAVVLGNILSLQGVVVPVQPYLGVDWSLAYEFWFYVLGGAIAACLIEARWRVGAIAVAIGAFLVFAVLEPYYLFCWLLGALVSQVQLKRLSPGGFLAGLVLTAVGLFLGNDLFVQARGYIMPGIAPSVSLARITVTVGVLIVLRNLVMLTPHGSHARRTDALGTRLAAFSYSLYLIHGPVLALCVYLGMPTRRALTAQSLAAYLACVILVPLAAYGFYWLFERHTDTIRRSIKAAVHRG